MTKTTTEQTTYLLDAKGQVLGRLATRAAELLRGKNKVDFVPYLDLGSAVVVVNAGTVVLKGNNKLTDKSYYHHTRYPGGIKETKVSVLMSTNPASVVRRAVYGMLPKNKLRDQFIKKLTIVNDDSYKKTGMEVEIG